jgi:adenine deaminase
MATINTADHFGLTQDIGMIAPGRYADILLVPDLEEFTPDMVMAKGKIVSQAGHILVDLPDYHYPAWASKSIHLRRPLQPSDLIIKTDRVDDAIANVIGIIENQAPTKLIKMPVNIDGGEIHSDIEKDICKVAVVERHHGTGRIQLGLTHGFGFTKPCAIASSVAHDSHHIIVVGTDDDCMATAVNKLAETGGGQIVILKGEVCGLVELPIGGLMSLESGQTVARKAANVLAGFQECGCRLNNPNMQLSLLALVVIPEIRISDLGLVDVSKMEFMKLVE